MIEELISVYVFSEGDMRSHDKKTDLINKFCFVNNCNSYMEHVLLKINTVWFKMKQFSPQNLSIFISFPLK